MTLFRSVTSYVTYNPLSCVQIFLIFHIAYQMYILGKSNTWVVSHSPTWKRKCKSIFTERACTNGDIYFWLWQEVLHCRNKKAILSLAICFSYWYAAPIEIIIWGLQIPGFILIFTVSEWLCRFCVRKFWKKVQS